MCSSLWVRPWRRHAPQNHTGQALLIWAVTQPQTAYFGNQHDSRQALQSGCFWFLKGAAWRRAPLNIPSYVLCFNCIIYSLNAHLQALRRIFYDVSLFSRTNGLWMAIEEMVDTVYYKMGWQRNHLHGNWENKEEDRETQLNQSIFQINIKCSIKCLSSGSGAFDCHHMSFINVKFDQCSVSCG